MIKKFRDVLALLTIIIVIPMLWVTQGLGILTMPGEVVGATIMGWGLILQFYFRKKPADEAK